MTHLGSIIERVGLTKPRINISLTQIFQSIAEHFAHNSLIIRRQFRFPNEISPRSAAKRPIQLRQFANLRRVQIPQNHRRAALRQIAETGFRWQRSDSNWVFRFEDRRETRTHSRTEDSNPRERKREKARRIEERERWVWWEWTWRI